MRFGNEEPFPFVYRPFSATICYRHRHATATQPPTPPPPFTAMYHPPQVRCYNTIVAYNDGNHYRVFCHPVNDFISGYNFSRKKKSTKTDRPFLLHSIMYTQRNVRGAFIHRTQRIVRVLYLCIYSSVCLISEREEKLANIMPDNALLIMSCVVWHRMGVERCSLKFISSLRTARICILHVQNGAINVTSSRPAVKWLNKYRIYLQFVNDVQLNIRMFVQWFSSKY